MSLHWFEDPPVVSPISQRVHALVGAPPRRFRAVSGGYTPVRRAVVELMDGRTVFIKLAINALTAGWLRAESRMYGQLTGGFKPDLLAFDDGEFPLLVLEDLSGARWAPPWRPGDVEAVRRALTEMAAAEVTLELPLVSNVLGQDPPGWREVARDPRPFLALGLVSENWLHAALPTLLAAEAAAPLHGSDLMHCDIRSDNLCFTDRGCVLIDWNMACRGNHLADVAFWLPSLHAEGGPAPDEVLSGQAELAAWTAGFFAARAGLPQIPDAPRVRYIQQVQLQTALPWAVRALGLRPLDL